MRYQTLGILVDLDSALKVKTTLYRNSVNWTVRLPWYMSEMYRVTIQVVTNLPLTPKQMLHFSTTFSYYTQYHL